MEETTVGTIAAFFQLLDVRKTSIFRGVSDAENHKLIPSVGRNWLGGLDELVQLEKQMLENLKSRAVMLLDSQPLNDWEWLIIGQHFGMPTRLLDWTANPLVALYFACAADPEEDGAVYLSEGLPRLNPDLVPDPFDITTDYLLAPRHISPRIMAQSAFFTVASDPTKPMEVTHGVYNLDQFTYDVSNLRIIVSRGPSKTWFLEELRTLGIGPASLFPGLEGLCRQIAMEDLSLREEKNREMRMKSFAEERKSKRDKGRE